MHLFIKNVQVYYNRTSVTQLFGDWGKVCLIKRFLLKKLQSKSELHDYL